jgi:hypothetical protein
MDSTLRGLRLALVLAVFGALGVRAVFAVIQVAVEAWHRH